MVRQDIIRLCADANSRGKKRLLIKFKYTVITRVIHMSAWNFAVIDSVLRTNILETELKTKMFGYRS